MQYIPQVKFEDLEALDAETLGRIKRVGTVIIRDIVPDEEAAKWKEELETFVKKNPDVDGKLTNCDTSQLYRDSVSTLFRRIPCTEQAILRVIVRPLSILSETEHADECNIPQSVGQSLR